MKIAVCDDDRQELLRLAALLEEYKADAPELISFETYSGGLELLAALHSEPYELLLLDVLMPGISGIETAQEIRSFNETVKIVFLTSTPEFAVDSYKVGALNYLLKPATREQLFPILDKLLEEGRKPEAVLPIRTRTRVFALPFSRIEYIEVMAKTLFFHLTDGSREEISGSLSEYEAVLLAQPGFIKTHRSYLVNLCWVRDVRQGELTTAFGKNVPVSRQAYPQVREAYMEQLFREKGWSNDLENGLRRGHFDICLNHNLHSA